jgi:hypothetical protein
MVQLQLSKAQGLTKVNVSLHVSDKGTNQKEVIVDVMDQIMQFN